MIRNPPIGQVELISGYLDYLLELKELESPLDLTMTLLFLMPLIYQHHTLYFLICLETSSPIFFQLKGNFKESDTSDFYLHSHELRNWSQEAAST